MKLTNQWNVALYRTRAPFWHFCEIIFFFRMFCVDDVRAMKNVISPTLSFAVYYLQLSTLKCETRNYCIIISVDGLILKPISFILVRNKLLPLILKIKIWASRSIDCLLWNAAVTAAALSKPRISTTFHKNGQMLCPIFFDLTSYNMYTTSFLIG